MGRVGEGREGTPKRRGADTDWLTLWAIGRYDLALSEREFWRLTLVEYQALCERDLERQDLLEYHAALACWATFSVNRKKEAEPLQPAELMFRRKWRLQQQPHEETSVEPAPSPVAAERSRHPHGWARPAILVAPVPESGARNALPGERPPSRLAPGERDNLIERFDAYRASWYAQKGPRG